MNKKMFFMFLFFSITRPFTDDAAKWHGNLWANYLQFSGNIPDSHHWYKKVSRKCVYGYKGYLTLLADTKQFDQIISIMPMLNKRFSQDPDIQLIFVNALQTTQQTHKADALVIQLSQSFRTHSEITLLAAQAYLRRQETENALLTINAYLNNTPRRPNNFIFYFLQSHIHAQLSQQPQALQSVQKCLEMHPHFDKGWLLQASLCEKEGNIQEAIVGYTTFLELTGSNKHIEQHIIKLQSQQK